MPLKCNLWPKTILLCLKWLREAKTLDTLEKEWWPILEKLALCCFNIMMANPDWQLDWVEICKTDLGVCLARTCLKTIWPWGLWPNAWINPLKGSNFEYLTIGSWLNCGRWSLVSLGECPWGFETVSFPDYAHKKMQAIDRVNPREMLCGLQLAWPSETGTPKPAGA